MSQSLQTATLVVDADVIRAYAELSEDYNPIHLDEAFAATTSMGGVIAHGTMSISLIWQALFRSIDALDFDSLDLDVRFLKPVRMGETLTAGGHFNTQPPGLIDVWVRGSDGSELIAGTARLATNLAEHSERTHDQS